MRLVFSLLLLLSFIIGCQADRRIATPPPSSPEIAPMSKEAVPLSVLSTIQRLETEHGVRIAVAFDPVTVDHPRFHYRGDEVFHAASTMKVPVMIEVFRGSDRGNWQMTDELIVTDTFKSFLDGSPFQAAGRAYLQSRVGEPESIFSLTEQMIIVSDNLATNMLIDITGATAITQTMQELGATNSAVLRGLMDMKAFDAGLSNTITARDLNQIMLAIEIGTAASPESNAAMKEILRGQRYLNSIPAGLPEGVLVGNKTGSISGVEHDTAIVEAPGGTYVVTVLMDGIPSDIRGSQMIAEISRSIYEAIFPR